MKLLIYGAGVIGDLYAAAFAEIWHNTSRGDDNTKRTVTYTQNIDYTGF